MVAYIIAVLVVVVILVFFVMYRGDSAGTSGAVDKSVSGTSGSSGTSGADEKTADPKHEGLTNFGPEIGAQNENLEYFSEGIADCHTCTGDLSYVLHEYGAPGMDFKDYISAKSLDPQIVKNHQEFVKDRLSSADNKTGPAFDPGYRMGELEGGDEVPWQGLRRPQHVPVGNPTQLPEFNPNSYTYGPKFTWSST